MSFCKIINKGTVNLIECHELLSKLKKVRSPVGEGQQGKVYILEDLNYAVKVIPKLKEYASEDDEELFSRESITSSRENYTDDDEYDYDEQDDEEEGTSEEDFSSEVEILNKINCPNVIKYYGAYEDDNNYYLVTEAIKGSHLGLYKLEEKEIIECVKQLVSGLQCIHESNVAHNDIKLENIMYDKKHQVYFIDFGLSCSECLGVHPGNDFYMAPEFLTGTHYEMTPVERLQKNDLWALGLVIIQIILWDIKDIKSQLEFGRLARGDAKKIPQIIKNTIPPLIDKVESKMKNQYIKYLLTNLTNIDPTQRKMV